MKKITAVVRNLGEVDLAALIAASEWLQVEEVVEETVVTKKNRSGATLGGSILSFGS